MFLDKARYLFDVLFEPTEIDNRQVQNQIPFHNTSLRAMPGTHVQLRPRSMAASSLRRLLVFSNTPIR